MGNLHLICSTRPNLYRHKLIKKVWTGVFIKRHIFKVSIENMIGVSMSKDMDSAPFWPYQHLPFCVNPLKAQWRCRCLSIRTIDTIATYRHWEMLLPVWRRHWSAVWWMFLWLCPQGLEVLLRHPEDNRNQIRELAQTLMDGGVLDELIQHKLDVFNTRWEELMARVTYWC